MSDPYMELGQTFKASVAALRRLRGRENHCPGELSDAQYGVLFGLREGQELPVGEVAVAADLSPASGTEMLEALAAAGLVDRRRSERDRRVVLVSLTPRGRKLVEARRSVMEPKWRSALSGFSEAELRTATAVLDRIRAFFDERSAERDAAVEVGGSLAGATHAEAGPR